MHNPDVPYIAKLPNNAPVEWRIQLTVSNANRHLQMAMARQRRELVPKFSGTGIVMCAGGKRYLRMAFQTLNQLRDSGCSLPVQIWHLGAQELPIGLRSAEYAQTGAILTPDIKPCRPSDMIFHALALKRPEPYVECESGQMMIDKTRHWRVVQMIRWMNDFSDFFYTLFHGDKSSFDLSFLKSGIPFTMLPPCSWEGWGIQQYWTDGSVFSRHRLDRKRNPKAPVSPQDQFWGRVFDNWTGVVPERIQGNYILDA